MRTAPGQVNDSIVRRTADALSSDRPLPRRPRPRRPSVPRGHGPLVGEAAPRAVRQLRPDPHPVSGAGVPSQVEAVRGLAAWRLAAPHERGRRTAVEVDLVLGDHSVRVRRRPGQVDVVRPVGAVGPGAESGGRGAPSVVRPAGGGQPYGGARGRDVVGGVAGPDGEGVAGARPQPRHDGRRLPAADAVDLRGALVDVVRGHPPVVRRARPVQLGRPAPDRLAAGPSRPGGGPVIGGDGRGRGGAHLRARQPGVPRIVPCPDGEDVRRRGLEPGDVHHVLRTRYVLHLRGAAIYLVPGDLRAPGHLVPHDVHAGRAAGRGRDAHRGRGQRPVPAAVLSAPPAGHRQEQRAADHRHTKASHQSAHGSPFPRRDWSVPVCHGGALASRGRTALAGTARGYVC